MESERTAERIDVLIGGGGFAGLALAIALRQGLGPSFSVTVADPALGRASDDGRASAIVAAARRLFETIGVWHQIETQPILDMAVTDSRLHDTVRPTFLTFEGDLEPGQPFAHMIENAPLTAALARQARAQGIELRATAVTRFNHDGARIAVSFGDGGAVSASLLVAVSRVKICRAAACWPGVRRS